MIKPFLQFIKQHFEALLAAIIGAVSIYILTNYHGIGLSPDSVVYTSVSRNIIEGKGIIVFGDIPLIIFPIGYPIFLAGIAAIFHHDILQLASGLNAVLFGISIFCTGMMLNQSAARNKWYKWIILSIIPICFSLVDIYSMLWSETLFITEICLFIIAIQHYAQQPNRKQLLLVAILTAFICVTRFAGVSVLATGLFCIFFHQQLTILKRLFHLLIYTLIASSLLAVNLIRNNIINGTATGIRQKSITPLWQNIRLLGNVWCEWFQLQEPRTAVAFVLGSCLLLFLLVNVLRGLRKPDKFSSYPYIHLVFAFIYIAFIILTATISKYEKINNRLLAPAFIAVLMSITYFIPIAIEKINQTTIKKLLIAFTIIVYAIFQYAQIDAHKALHENIAENGHPGYNELIWQESDIVQFLKTEKKFFNNDTLIFSNGCEAVYYYGGLPAYTIPEKVHTEAVREYYNEEPSYLLWFTNEFHNPAVLSLAEISKHRHLDTLAKFQDGIIFWTYAK